MNAQRNGLRAAMCASALGLVLAISGCAQTSLSSVPPSAGADSNTIHPENWPRAQSGVRRDAAIEAEVARILAQMTIEDKVGQIIQADVNSVTPDEVRQYRLGSVLNGGNSGPAGDDRAPAARWVEYADLFYDASMAAYGNRIAIPVIWGSDAVHGNANIIGATIFPHNIGLGAMRNPELMRRIGEITALETRITGQDWTFAPTIAVVRDDRWGRTYEGYSEDPEIVREYATAIVEGIQGRPGDADFLRGPHVIATAKHFLGDGGTDNGRDQGDNTYSEAQLRDIFAPGYPAAVEAGVQSVMASYNSWHGVKSHGNRALLNDVLVERFGFDGFVVGDWNGHGQVPGCTATNCAASVNAGLDMYMAPETWRDLYTNTLAAVRSGELPMARLDEAVSRILRVKLRAGLFTAGRPSSRPFTGDFNLLGSAEHRAVSRQAARESLVLLKNEDGILPLRGNLNVLVAGDGADNLGKQTGGWTISWQGSGNVRADFPNGQTIFEGIRERVQRSGGRATLSVDGALPQRTSSLCPDDDKTLPCQANTSGYDVAIVVFGEDPYAEFQGDRETLDYQPDGATDLALIQRLRARGIPVVAVFLSGRAMYVTPEINASNAFVAAWLPGSEGGAISDVLFRAPNGSVAHDFRGRLSFSWPRAPDQVVNRGDADYNPLFAYGYGMNYGNSRNLGQIPEAVASSAQSTSSTRYFEAGRAVSPWAVSLAPVTGAPTPVSSTAATAQIDGVALSRIDRAQQEDAMLVRFTGGRSALVISGTQVDLSRQTNGDMSLGIDVRVDEVPTGPVIVAMSDGGEPRGFDIGPQLRSAVRGAWVTIPVRLSCFGTAGTNMGAVNTPLRLSSSGRATLGVSTVRVVSSDGAPSCPAAAP